MRFWITFIFTVAITSCQEPEPTYYEGTANVIITDSEINDTLRTCYCWQTQDSLNLFITRGPYMGIAVEITGKNNLYSTAVQYYSDTNEFDGEFNFKVPVVKDSLNLSFQNKGDSIRISGFLEIQTEAVKFYKDGRTVQAFGNFSCMMAKNN